MLPRRFGVLLARLCLPAATCKAGFRSSGAALLQDENTGAAIFDGELKARHRDRAAYLAGPNDPFLETVTDRLLDRLEDCKRKFPHAAVIGGAAEHVLKQLAGGRAGIERVTYIDTSQDMLGRVQAKEHEARLLSGQGASTSTSSGGSSAGGSSTSISSSSSSSSSGRRGAWPSVEYVKMEGELLPTEPETFDLIISSLGMHWFNDLPTMVAQCRFALKPDGLLLAALMGGDTLHELRIACSLAQMEVLGGVSPVVSPLAQVRDAGNLLTRAGLAMPTVDLDTFKMMYSCPTEVVRHLRAMGESNAAVQRQRVMRRDVALAAAAVYRTMFDEDGSVPATFQVMYMTGWAPHESQQQPLARGSATVSFQELATGLVSQGAIGGSEADAQRDKDRERMAAAPPPIAGPIPRPPPPATPPTDADLAAWCEYEHRLTPLRGAGVTDAELAAVRIFVQQLSANMAGPPTWFGPSVAAAVGPAVTAAVGPAVAAAVGPAVAAAVGPLINMFARAHNEAVIGTGGRRLVPLSNAAGLQPPAADWPSSTSDVISWQNETSRNVQLWEQVHRLLQFYGVIDPATHLLFVAAAPAALPACPTLANGFVADLQHAVAEFVRHITR